MVDFIQKNEKNYKYLIYHKYYKYYKYYKYLSLFFIQINLKLIPFKNKLKILIIVISLI